MPAIRVRVLVVLTIAFVFLTVAASIGILLVLILMPDRREDLATRMLVAAFGLLGVLAGIFIIWSTHIWSARHDRAIAFAAGLAGLMFALACLLALYPLFLGLGHLYGPLVLALIALAIWNLLEVALRRVQ